MSSFRTLGRALVAAAILVAVSAAPASAHDELVSSTPASGAQLEAAPTEVSLSFSSEVMDLGAMVLIVDADDRDWADGEPTIREADLTVAIREGMPVGGYEIRWRVVSADGHPISGVIPFTVGDAEPLQSTADTTSGPATASPTAATDTAQESQSESGGVPRAALIGVGGAAVAVAAYAGIHLVRRRRTAHDTDAADAPTSEDSERHSL